MIIKFYAKNFMAFKDEIIFDLESDLRTKKLLQNISKTANGNIAKSAAIYGPNNTGKTCFIKAVEAYKTAILNNGQVLAKNLFSKSNVIKMGSDFIFNEIRYQYEFDFNVEKRIFEYEKLSKLEFDTNERMKEKVILLRNINDNNFICVEKNAQPMLKMLSKTTIALNALDTSGFKQLDNAKKDLIGFANSLIFYSMNNPNLNLSLNYLKDGGEEAEKIVNIIKNADLDIDDFRYDVNNPVIDIIKKQNKEVQNEDLEVLRLVSVHKGREVPSLWYDSLGTEKMISFAGYIIKALKEGGTLFVDELDAGIHFKLSRAMISLFNNSINSKGQLIFTTHDIALLDIKTLFRKEQIWFTDKDSEQSHIYPLSQFTTREGVRIESDLVGLYNKGAFGAIPNPNLIEVLLERDI